MFRIECFCDDKNLAKVKWALFELGAYNVTDQPVKENKANGKQNLGRVELVSQFLAYAKQHKLKSVRAKNVKEFVAGIGYSSKSYSHVLGVLRADGLIKKTGTGMSVDWVLTARSKRPAKKKEAAS